MVSFDPAVNDGNAHTLPGAASPGRIDALSSLVAKQSVESVSTLVGEQVEEEAWTARMVTLTGRASSDADLMHLDRHIMEQLGAAGPGAGDSAAGT